MNSMIESNFTYNEQKIIEQAIKENPNANIRISISMDYVSCYVGGKLIICRQSYQAMLNEIYNCKLSFVDDLTKAVVGIQ